jgi:hypothetical protein
MEARMRLERSWAMPSPQTFTIRPIGVIIERFMSAGGEWIDPFCRSSIFKDRCLYSNDLNPKFAGTHNMDALDFLQSFPDNRFDGVLFDPPFSPRQAKEEYSGFGALADLDTSRRFYSHRKREAARVLKIGGVAIVCGWNSLGLGKKNGMEIEEVHMVNHGDQNDTIVTVCRKTSDVFSMEARNE